MVLSTRLVNDLLIYDLLYKTPSTSLSLLSKGRIHLSLQVPAAYSQSFLVVKAHFLFFYLLNRFPKLSLGLGGVVGGGVGRRPISFVATVPLLSPLFDRLLLEFFPTLSRRELPFRSFLTPSGWVLVLKEFAELGVKNPQYDYFGWKFPLLFRLELHSPLLPSFFRIQFLKAGSI